jgi:hypothetical protein
MLLRKYILLQHAELSYIAFPRNALLLSKVTSLSYKSQLCLKAHASTSMLWNVVEAERFEYCNSVTA